MLDLTTLAIPALIWAWSLELNNEYDFIKWQTENDVFVNTDINKVMAETGALKR